MAPLMSPRPKSPVSQASVSRLRVALGCFVAIECTAATSGRAEAALERAFDAVLRVQALMKPDDPRSDIAAIHRALPGQRVRVDRWTWEVLRLCNDLHVASSGLFDPCVIGRWSDLVLVPEQSVEVRGGVRIDLGGIAKG